MDSAVYLGWGIYAHVGAVANNEIPVLKIKVKGWFDPERFEYEGEDSYTISFYHKSTKSQVIITFRPQFTNVESTMGLDHYGVAFKSDFCDWGWRASTRRNEGLHKQLCDEVSHRITWHNEAHYLVNNELIPAPKPRRLRRLLRMRKR